MTNTDGNIDSDPAAASAALSAGQGSGERADILEALRTQRYFLKHTVTGLSDEQARLTPTVSALCLGGLIKHVASTESAWVDFIEQGPSAMPAVDGDFANIAPEVAAAWAAEFQMLPEEDRPAC